MSATATAASAFREGLARETAPAPCAIVIFGATGDLTHRKLLPALFRLDRQGLLPPRRAIVGVARKELSDEAFAAEVKAALTEHGGGPPDEETWADFARDLRYVTGEFADPAAFTRLAELLERLDRESGTDGNRLFYFAVPPSFYAVLFERLSAAGLMKQQDGRFARVVVEKPFGRDLDSARDLNAKALAAADESQIFRIDHYLGKETVQNILVFRFGNAIFEPIWNHRFVDQVQITVGESIGVEGRGKFYEEAGASRDIVQNHLMQLLSLVAMEPPIAYEADAIRNEKVKVLQSIPILKPREVREKVVRGQYGPGSVEGEDVPGYRQEPGVAPDSTVETYVALELAIDNWRWAGVPFYVRAGKRLPKRVTEIAVTFKSVPHAFFGGSSGDGVEPNVLALRIQPEEGISLKFEAKVPGQALRVEPVKMDFLYGSSFGAEVPEAYERLLLEALVGDRTLFIRKDEVEAAWAIVSAVHAAWADEPPPAFPNYDAGTWGPEAAQALLARAGRQWRRP
jgi:glucose-6-phosphate 1-dehydrogenase